MSNLGSFPVHDSLGANDLASEYRCNGLMTQAYAKYGVFTGISLHERHREARGFGPPRPRGYDDHLGREFGHLIEFELIVSPHRHIRAQFGQILNEVVGERIVIIDHQYARHVVFSALGKSAPRHVQSAEGASGLVDGFLVFEIGL